MNELDASDSEMEFLVTGAKTYLDIDDAMAQFRRKVQERTCSQTSKRLQDLNGACEMGWTPSDLRDYASRQSDCFWVGKQISVLDFGILYFCLKIFRENGNLAFVAQVDLWRQRMTIAQGLYDSWSSANG